MLVVWKVGRSAEGVPGVGTAGRSTRDDVVRSGAGDVDAALRVEVPVRHVDGDLPRASRRGVRRKKRQREIVVRGAAAERAAKIGVIDHRVSDRKLRD